MRDTTETTQTREEYAAPKLQQIEMSDTSGGANPGNPEGTFGSAS